MKTMRVLYVLLGLVLVASLSGSAGADVLRLAPTEVTVVETVAVVEPPGWTVPAAGPSASEKSLLPEGVQVGSPLCAGTLTASQAALVRLK